MQHDFRRVCLMAGDDCQQEGKDVFVGCRWLFGTLFFMQNKRSEKCRELGIVGTRMERHQRIKPIVLNHFL